MNWESATKHQLLTIIEEDCPLSFKYRACAELQKRYSTYVKEGIEYTYSNRRMKYNPEFHENHGKLFTLKDLAYLCSTWGSLDPADIAMALGRTHGTVLNKVYLLKKSGQFEQYKELGEMA